jgi:hypothetical protein
MEFSEELIEELSGKMRSFTANLRKTQKKTPESEIKLEIYDPINEVNLIYSLDEIPDFSIIVEELEFPEKIKIDYYLDGQKKKSSVFFEKKEERKNQTIPNYQNSYPNQTNSISPDFREIMTGLERMISNMSSTQKEIMDSSLKLQKETIVEMKALMGEQVSTIKNLSQEKINFESSQKKQEIESIQNDYSRKLKLETDSFEERLKREKEHQEALKNLEIDRAKLSKDSSSNYVQNVNASIEITKAIVEATKDVIPAIMETVIAVKTANATNVTPIPAV